MKKSSSRWSEREGLLSQYQWVKMSFLDLSIFSEALSPFSFGFRANCKLSTTSTPTPSPNCSGATGCSITEMNSVILYSLFERSQFQTSFLLTSVRTLDKGWLLTRAAMKDSGLVGVYLDECLTTLLNVLKKTGFFVCNLMSLTQRIRSIWLESKEIFLLFQSNKLSCTL